MTWEPNYLSIQSAAKRVDRDVRTVERWIEAGQIPVLVVRNSNGTVLRRYVEETDLLREFRRSILNNPTRPNRRDKT